MVDKNRVDKKPSNFIVMVNAISFAGNEPPNMQTDILRYREQKCIHIWLACCHLSGSTDTNNIQRVYSNIYMCGVFVLLSILFCSVHFSSYSSPHLSISILFWKPLYRLWSLFLVGGAFQLTFHSFWLEMYSECIM